MRVDVSKNGLTLARHNGLVVYVGTDDGQVIQEAIDYIELYQSKWYRRIKNWVLRLFRRGGNLVHLGAGQYDVYNTINLASNLTLRGSEQKANSYNETDL